MALVAKSALQRDLGKRQIGLSEKLLRSFQPPLYQIKMWRRSDRLLECSSKMPLRQPSDTGKRFQLDILPQVPFNIFAYA
jgi:hypothetical protein